MSLRKNLLSSVRPHPTSCLEHSSHPQKVIDDVYSFSSLLAKQFKQPNLRIEVVRLRCAPVGLPVAAQYGANDAFCESTLASSSLTQAGVDLLLSQSDGSSSV